MDDLTDDEYERAFTQALDLGRMIETFFIELVDGGFMEGCVCCKFPTPTPFVNLTTGELLCRKCRMAHDEEGNHIGKI